MRGIHRGPVNSPHKRPVTRKMFPFDDVVMSRWVSRHYPSGYLQSGFKYCCPILSTMLISFKSIRHPDRLIMRWWRKHIKILLTHIYIYICYERIILVTGSGLKHVQRTIVTKPSADCALNQTLMRFACPP